MQKDTDLTWSEKSRTPLLKTVVMTVMETQSISPDGTSGKYIVMDASDWVIVIPDMDDSFLMVKQWRHGEQKLSIEFPGGVIEKNEPPEKAAGRELKEETGYVAGKLIKLGTMNPNPALMSNHIHIFAALNLERQGDQSLDSDEYLNYLKIKKAEVYKEMGSEKYPHALMSAALFLYQNSTNPLIRAEGLIPRSPGVYEGY